MTPDDLRAIAESKKKGGTAAPSAVITPDTLRDISRRKKAGEAPAIPPVSQSPAVVPGTSVGVAQEERPWHAFFTGEGRTEYPDAPEVGTSSSRLGLPDAGRMWAYATAPNDESLARMLASDLNEDTPGHEVFQDSKGAWMVRNPAGEVFHANKPGASEADMMRFATDILAFTPAGRVAGRPATFLGRVAAGGGAAAGTEAALQAGAAASSPGDVRFDPSRVVAAGAGGAAGEALQPIVGAISRGAGKARRVFQRGQQVSDEFDVPMSQGQKADDAALMAREDALRDRPGGQDYTDFRRNQADAYAQAVEDVSGAPLEDTGQALATSLRSSYNAQKKVTDDAYDAFYATLPEDQAMAAPETVNTYITAALRKGRRPVQTAKRTTPGAHAAKKEIEKLQNAKGPMTIGRFDETRRIIASIEPQNKQDALALSRIKEGFDDWADTAVRGSNLSEDSLRLYEIARRENTELRSAFNQRRGRGPDPGGRIIEDITQSAQAPGGDKTINAILGDPRALSRTLAAAPNMRNDLGRALMKKAFGTAKTPKQVLKKIDQLKTGKMKAQGDLAIRGELRSQLDRFEELTRRLAKQEDVQPSKTWRQLSQHMEKLLGAGSGAAIGSVAGPYGTGAGAIAGTIAGPLMGTVSRMARTRAALSGGQPLIRGPSLFTSGGAAAGAAAEDRYDEIVDGLFGGP